MGSCLIGPQKVSSVQFSSVSQSCPTLCNPMDCSMPGFPVPSPWRVAGNKKMNPEHHVVLENMITPFPDAKK